VFESALGLSRYTSDETRRQAVLGLYRAHESDPGAERRHHLFYTDPNILIRSWLPGLFLGALEELEKGPRPAPRTGRPGWWSCVLQDQIGYAGDQLVSPVSGAAPCPGAVRTAPG